MNLRQWWHDRQRGYTNADANIVRIKIAAGIKVEDAKLTKAQRRALLDIPDREIWQLAGFDPDSEMVRR